MNTKIRTFSTFSEKVAAEQVASLLEIISADSHELLQVFAPAGHEAHQQDWSSYSDLVKVYAIDGKIPGNDPYRPDPDVVILFESGVLGGASDQFSLRCLVQLAAAGVEVVLADSTAGGFSVAEVECLANVNGVTHIHMCE